MHGVWIDREKALIFRSEEGRFRFLMEFEGSAGEAGFLQIGPGELRFQRLAGELKAAKQIFLIGPGIAKHSFRTYLTEQYPAIGRKVAAVKEADASIEFEAENLLSAIQASLGPLKGKSVT